MLGWLERNDYKMAGPDRVLYLNNPEEVTPEEILQELQIPISKS